MQLLTGPYEEKPEENTSWQEETLAPFPGSSGQKQTDWASRQVVGTCSAALRKQTPHLEHPASSKARLWHGSLQEKALMEVTKLPPWRWCQPCAGSTPPDSKHRLQRRRQQRRKHGGETKNSVCFPGHLLRCRSRLPKQIPAQRWLGKNRELFWFFSIQHPAKGMMRPTEPAGGGCSASGDRWLHRWDRTSHPVHYGGLQELQGLSPAPWLLCVRCLQQNWPVQGLI